MITPPVKDSFSFFLSLIGEHINENWTIFSIRRKSCHRKS